MLFQLDRCIVALSVADFKYHLQVDFCKSRFPVLFLISVR